MKTITFHELKLETNKINCSTVSAIPAPPPPSSLAKKFTKSSYKKTNLIWLAQNEIENAIP